MAGRRRHRTKAEIQRDQATRVVSEASSLIVSAYADHLQSPKPEADLVGEQSHFLRRIERLPDEVRGLAIRVYYSYELRRFLAREALGVPVARIGFEAEPADLAERRVVVSIEPGPTPSRLIFDGRGKVVTCLAPDMAVGSGTRVSYEQLKKIVARFKGWQELQDHARDTAESTDLLRLCNDLARAGWLSSREMVETLAGLGPAGAPLVVFFIPTALTAMGDAFIKAFGPGPRDDLRLRDWFRQTARVVAFLTLLADWRVEPKLDDLLRFAALNDPVFAMVIGACLAVWRPYDGNHVAASVVEEEHRLISFNLTLTMFFGMRRRLLAEQDGPPELVERTERWLVRCREDLEADLRERCTLGDAVTPLRLFQRDLMVLAHGGRPDWGDDLADDPDTLPPIRLDDLCVPGNETSTRALRFLAQRLFAGAVRPLRHLFLPAAELERWHERLGSLDEVRSGDFHPPGIERDKPSPPVRTGLPGRNEPCPCGSGRKFKKCCLPKMEAGEDVG